MKIKIIAVGSKMPSWVQEGCQEYAKRLPKSWCTQWIEIPVAKKGNTPQELMEQEADAILSRIASDDAVIALERKGQQWSSMDLVDQLRPLDEMGKSVCLIIGGPEGLSPKVQSKAHKLWSLSELTYPHPIVRIILMEAIYRSWAIINRLPYHR